MELKYILILVALWLLVAAAIWRAFIYPRARRKRLDNTSFPKPWLAILRRNLTVYKSMWPDQQAQLRKLIVRFLADKNFEGCAGQQITDEIRITIAAHACLLLLNRPTHEYADLRTILVYPSAFTVKRDSHDENGLVSNSQHVLAGESWSNGKIIHRDSLIDEYGATNPAEFFAVVTEVFFEQPHQLEQRHKALFDELLNYYKVDPREWQHQHKQEHTRHAS